METDNGRNKTIDSLNDKAGRNPPNSNLQCCKATGLRPPAFDIDARHFTVTVYRPEFDEHGNRIPATGEEVRVKTAEVGVKTVEVSPSLAFGFFVKGTVLDIINLPHIKMPAETIGRSLSGGVTDAIVSNRAPGRKRVIFKSENSEKE